MPRIEHIITALIILFVITVFIRHNNRTEAQKEERKLRPSWATRTLAAATGADLEATRLLPAVRELAGRGVAVAAGRTRDTVAARVATGRARRTELAAAAVRRGRAVVEATQRRWGRRSEDRPFIDRRATEDAPVPAGEPSPGGPRAAGAGTPVQPEPAGEGSPVIPEPKPRWRRLRRFAWWRNRDGSGTTPEARPDGSASPALTRDTVCRTCGTQHSVTIPEGENAGEVVCGCRTRIIIFRDLRGEAPPVTDPDAWVGWQTLVAAENGYCTSIRCTGNGTYIHITPDGVNKTPCPTCTPNKENTDMADATTRTLPNAAIPQQAFGRNVNGASGADAATVAQLSPADWAQTAERVRDAELTADYELINLMTGEVAGICVYAEAYHQLHATCVDTIGLDPVAVQGLGEFAEHVMELAKAMSDNHQQFLAQYQEVLQAVANGVVLPYNGRWMTGEAAV